MKKRKKSWPRPCSHRNWVHISNRGVIRACDRSIWTYEFWNILQFSVINLILIQVKWFLFKTTSLLTCESFERTKKGKLHRTFACLGLNIDGADESKLKNSYRFYVYSIIFGAQWKTFKEIRLRHSIISKRIYSTVLRSEEGTHGRNGNLLNSEILRKINVVLIQKCVFAYSLRPDSNKKNQHKYSEHFHKIITIIFSLK